VAVGPSEEFCKLSPLPVVLLLAPAAIRTMRDGIVIGEILFKKRHKNVTVNKKCRGKKHLQIHMLILLHKSSFGKSLLRMDGNKICE